MIATLFYNPIALPSDSTLLWLLLPVMAGVAIIYKAVRTKQIKKLPLEILVLMVYIVIGLFALGGGLYLFQKYLL